MQRQRHYTVCRFFSIKTLFCENLFLFLKNHFLLGGYRTFLYCSRSRTGVTPLSTFWDHLLSLRGHRQTDLRSCCAFCICYVLLLHLWSRTMLHRLLKLYCFTYIWSFSHIGTNKRYYYRFCNWNAHGCQSLFERSSQRWCFCACAVVGPLDGWPCNNHRWRWSVNTVRWIDANPRPQVAAFFHANANTGLLQQVLCDQLNRGDQTAVPSAQSGDVNEPWEFFVLGRRMHRCWYQLRWYVASISRQCATNVIGCEVGD